MVWPSGESLRNAFETEREKASDDLDFERAAAVHKKVEKLEEVLRGRPDLARRIQSLDALILQRGAGEQDAERSGEEPQQSAAAGELRFGASNPAQLAQIAQIIFLALPHGFAAEFTKPLVQTDARIVDLSADFRIKDPKIYKEFYGNDHPAPDLLGKAVYGLPEIYGAEISHANLVACPGCYPTSILLPLLPLIRGRDQASRS